MPITRLSTIAKTTLVCALALTVTFGAVAPAAAAPANTSDATCKKSRPRVSFGAKGGCVNYAQRKLSAMGYMTYTKNTENTFGSRTLAAVNKIQADYCPSKANSIGPCTWAAMHGERKKNGGSTGTAASGSIPQKCLNKMSGSKTICVVKKGGFGTLYAMRKDTAGKIRLDYQIPIRTGDNRPGDWDTAEGTFKVIQGRKHREYTNRDGVSMPRSMFFYGGQAIHYSSTFDANPTSGYSKGCVNIGSLSKATALFNWTPEGTRVYITK